ncbi:MAG: dienelactone hydrolase family protein [Fimbriimonadaceae bacterium]|nr:dienelactone hydrolase family protein [Fimbriimonadaceae bacterium]
MIAALVCLFTIAAPQTQEFTVDGVKRTALIYAPTAKSKKAPLVLAFHGHGGNSRNSARTMSLHTEWPEAVVIYPQGLTGNPGITDTEGKKTGWQKTPDQQNGRDIHFVENILDWAKKTYKIDSKRIFATGHSNGSAFTWVVMTKLGDKFTAFAGACGGGGLYAKDAPKKPVMIIGALNDTLVPIRSIRFFTDAMVKKNGCGAGQPGEKGMTTYPGEYPVVSYIYDGGHALPEDIGKRIVKFFKEVK